MEIKRREFKNKTNFFRAFVNLWILLVLLTSVACHKNASRTPSQNAVRTAVSQEVQESRIEEKRLPLTAEEREIWLNRGDYLS
jgi:hypothetical protein